MKEYERFTSEDYFEITGEQKKYLTAFICQADYTDELSFYKSLDILTNQYYDQLLDKEQSENLSQSRQYILKMGMEEAKKVLLIIARK